MKKNKIILIIFSLVGMSIAAVAGRYFLYHPRTDYTVSLPGVKEEYTRLAEHFASQDSLLNMTGEIKLYDGKTPETLKEHSGFVFSKNGQRFYAELSGQQSICDGKIIAQVDTINKNIYISQAKGQLVLLSSLKNPAMPMDRLFSDTASFKTRGTISGDDKERKIVLKSELTPEIRSYTIVYDPSTYTIRRAEIEWWKNNTSRDTVSLEPVWITDIEYQYPSSTQVDVDKVMQSVITINHNKYIPTPAYSKYTIQVQGTQEKTPGK